MRFKTKDPVIKWSGSKRKIAPVLAPLMPENGGCYYEPFLGSGAMLPFRKSKKAVAGDIIPELMALWEIIRDDPEGTAKEYSVRWTRLQTEGHTAYYDIRDSFNSTRNPHDLLFLSRTCVNGLIRFNSDKDFNNSLHHTRPGIAPNRLRSIILEWSHILSDVQLLTGDYRETLATVKEGDIVFLDPPYGGTKGRYIPDPFGMEEFYGELERLNEIGARWILTFDGHAGDRTYDATPPEGLYVSRFALPTGNAPFTKLMKTSIEQVLESVYLNFEPSGRSIDQIGKYRKEKLRSRTHENVQEGALF